MSGREIKYESKKSKKMYLKKKEKPLQNLPKKMQIIKQAKKSYW